MHFSKMTLLPLVLAASVSTAAVAQQKDCTIDEGKPSQVARAMLAIQQAGSAKTPADAQKQLSSAVKLLSDADPTQNPVGRNYELGKALVVWLGQPDATPVMKRGTLGFTTNPDGTIDLVTAIDSVFTIVETAQPSCVSETNQLRGYKGWVNLVNGALTAQRNGQADSAVALAKRALVLFHGSPYAYMVLGQVADQKGNSAEAIKQYKQAVAEGAKDTTYSDVRRQVLLMLGTAASNAASNATPADKATYAAEAKSAFEALLKDPGKPVFADEARQGLATLALSAGDTASFRNVYKDQIANPGAYDFQQLIKSGVSAAQGQQWGDAVTLFRAAYDKNPYHRDVLYNLAIAYRNQNTADKGLPLLHQLITVDPWNENNYRAMVASYVDLQKVDAAADKQWSEKNRSAVNTYNKLSAAAQKGKNGVATLAAAKLAADSMKYYEAQARIMTDSALKYNDVATKLPAQVTFTEFTPHENNTYSLSGTVTNKTDAPKTYTLKIEFVDAKGNVVTTQTANVGPVAPNQQGTFSVTATGAGIAAFRYAPSAG